MATPNRRRLEYLSLDEVKPAKRNPKLHDDASLDASLDRFGFTEPVLLDERTGRLVAGHGRLERLRQARDRGDAAPEGIQVLRDGTWKLPVIRGWSSRNDAEAEAYLVASNRIVETGGWDLPELADILGSIRETDLGLDGIGYDPASLDELLESLAAPEPEPEPIDDEPIEPPTKPVTRAGDVWLLGPHRLVCGDSRTDPGVLDLATGGVPADMVWTDPPYGVSYIGKTDDALTIQNDSFVGDGLYEFLLDAFTAAAKASKPGAVWMVAAPAGPQLLAFARSLSELGIWRQSLVWVKDQFVLGHSDYHYRHEVMFFGWVPGAAHRAPGDRAQDTVWEIPRPRRSEEHPTMKPVALVQRAVREHTTTGELVLDPFGGSGTTLLAADSLDRVAALVEIDPAYCDVICARFERHTGIVPVLERTGKPRSFAPRA